MSYKVGIGQMLVEGGQLALNLGRALGMIVEAARRGCSLVVLPECLDVGWTHPSARELAAPIPGDRTALLSRAAAAHKIFVCAGLTENHNGALYNSAILISPEGELLHHHRKINELDIATELYATGDRLGVVDTELGKLGVSICADNFPETPMFAEAMARMGAQVLLSPCAWAVDADHDNERDPYGGLWLDSYTRLARLYDLTIVAASNVGWLNGGPWKGRKCIGNSLAVGPGGQILARGPYGEEAEQLIVVEVEPAKPVARGTGFIDAVRQRSAGSG
jgi:predicted amidohydrolase